MDSEHTAEPQRTGHGYFLLPEVIVIWDLNRNRDLGQPEGPGVERNPFLVLPHGSGDVVAKPADEM